MDTTSPSVVATNAVKYTGFALRTVILPLLLLLCGVQSRMKSVPARMVIVILGSLILAYGLFTIATAPVI
jgi:hypothetical protein